MIFLGTNSRWIVGCEVRFAMHKVTIALNARGENGGSRIRQNRQAVNVSFSLAVWLPEPQPKVPATMTAHASGFSTPTDHSC